MAKINKATKQLKVTLLRSKFGRVPGHRQCVEGLGLRRIRQTVLLENTQAVKGMINKVRYLLKVEEIG